MNAIPYRPEIDGLRAIAVIPVILFHFGISWLPGGYIGVDIFFVISGFLITGIILKDYHKQCFSFKDFWLRRIRRILPVLILVVLSTLIIGRYLMYAPEISNLGIQGIASLLSFANINQLSQSGDYWGFKAENSPLLHTWSLSVEEQFYLFFPLLIILCLKYREQLTRHIITLLVVLSLLLFFYGVQHNPDKTFYLLPTRAWELGVGALIAVFIFHENVRFKSNHILPIVGMTLILASYYLLDGKSGISSLLVIPVAGVALIILFAQTEKSILNKCLSFKPLIYTGKISYSLYLWHWPILVLSHNLQLRTGAEYNKFFLFCIVFLLSIFSYHLIERPMRHNKRLTPYILLMLIVSVIYAYTLSNKELIEDVSRFNQTEWDGELYSVAPKEKISESVAIRMKGISFKKDLTDKRKAYLNGGIQKRVNEKPPEIVVLGDSHGLMWSRVLDEIATSLELSISFYAADGTPTFFDIPISKSGKTFFFSEKEKFDYDTARLKYLKKWKPKVVIISRIWSTLHDKKIANDLVKYLGTIGSRVYFIEQPPELFFGDKNTPQFLSYSGLTPNNDKQYIEYSNTESYKRGNKNLKTVVEQCNYCELIPVADIFIQDRNKSLVLDGKNVLYIDDDHLSYAGSLKAYDRLKTALKDAFE